MAVAEKLAELRARIDAASKKNGRSGADVTLVAVTKTANVAKILEAKAAGITVFGENRVQDAQEKIPQVPADGVVWQMIGHLQSNKVKLATSLFSLIQSVDSVKLAKAIHDEALATGKIVPVLLEVNISGEAQKYGFNPQDVYSAMDEIALLPNIRVEGLMGIAPNTPDIEAKRKAFKNLKGIFSVCKGLKHENVQMKILSMGMSDDFEIAVEEGSTMVRLGRALFQ